LIKYTLNQSPFAHCHNLFLFYGNKKCVREYRGHRYLYLDAGNTAAAERKTAAVESTKAAVAGSMGR
jgi:hypothetical protein